MVEGGDVLLEYYFLRASSLYNRVTSETVATCAEPVPPDTFRLFDAPPAALLGTDPEPTLLPPPPGAPLRSAPLSFVAAFVVA